MLTAYLDESGHDSAGWMFIAGFLGTDDQWKDFAPKWKAALGPQRKSLHMKDLRWNSVSTRKLLARLGPIPMGCKLQAMLTGVRFQDYEDLLTGTKEQKNLKAYLACLLPMVIQTLRGIPDNERLELVFEQQNEYEPFANLALSTGIPAHPSMQTKDGRPKLAKWSFVPKGSTSLIEPADYFAYALREIWTNRKSKKADWCKPMLLSGDRQAYGIIFTRKKIRELVSKTFFLKAALDLKESADKLRATLTDSLG